jgi:hypothetical protein
MSRRKVFGSSILEVEKEDTVSFSHFEAKVSLMHTKNWVKKFLDFSSSNSSKSKRALKTGA